MKGIGLEVEMEKIQTTELKYPLSQLYLYLTKGCNLACRHCWIAPEYQTENNSYPFLDLELFQSILNQAKPLGLYGVKLTGGEPLLHPQILKILELINTDNLTLSVETNGVLCTPELAQRIAACKNSFVSVSLDGADAETHEWVRGVTGCFENALDGIRNLVSAGLKPQIIMTVMRSNEAQMEAVVHLAESLGASSVKYNILQPIARGKKMYQSGETLPFNELVELGQWVEEELSVSTNLRISYSHPPAFRPLGKMFGDNGDGCSVCGIFNILGVLANGSYALCGIGETVSDLIFGHASQDSLWDIWNNTPVLREIREGLSKRLYGICGDCVIRGRCLGNCIAQNYYHTSDLWAPFWYCDEAQKLGLFPETRKVPRQEF